MKVTIETTTTPSKPGGAEPAQVSQATVPLDYQPPDLRKTDPSPCPGDRRRIHGLDALRGIAASSVVLYHYTSNYQRVYGHRSKPFASFEYGALGVQLFFLISGFVIFMTLERTRRPIDFARSRFSRLYPAYWAAVLLTAMVCTLAHLPGRTPSLPRVAVNLTMLQQLVGVGNVDGVYWTLQVELCFYGIMFLLFMAGQLRRVEFWLLGLTAARVGEILLYRNDPLFFHVHPHLGRAITFLDVLLILHYAYAFLIGIMLYRIWRDGHRLHWWAVICACLTYSALFEPHVDFGLTLLFLAMVYCGSHGWLRIFENRAVLFLGFISYTLYLTHQNIGYVVIRWAERHEWNANLAIAFAILVALAVATALAYGVERPALRLMRGKRPA